MEVAKEELGQVKVTIDELEHVEITNDELRQVEVINGKLVQVAAPSSQAASNGNRPPRKLSALPLSCRQHHQW